MARLSASFEVGSLHVAAVSDGAPERALSGFFAGVDPAAWTAALGITDPGDPVPFNFGSFLVRDGERTVLIDTGWGAAGRSMGAPGGGELLQRLADLQVRPADVDAIVHTHLHPDHCGWNVTDGETPALTFPSATIYVSRTELDYWVSPELDGNERAAVARRATLIPQAHDRIATFDGEFDVTPAIRTIPTPGHTPGHTSLMLASGGSRLLIAGDAAHHPVHFEHHDWIPAVDLDPAESRRSRRRLAEIAADTGAWVTGGHFPILTLGTVERVEQGFRWRSL